jgi:hypothetical protein
MPKTATAPKLLSVPAGTRASHCSGSVRGGTCSKLIYWGRTPQGRSVPIDCDVPGGRRPSEAKETGQLDVFGGEAKVFDGRGQSHFETCPDVALFSRGSSPER